MTKSKHYVHFEDMTWPNPESDIEWRLRHTPESITPSDMMIAASFVYAYKHLLSMNSKYRTEICRKIKSNI